MPLSLEQYAEYLDTRDLPWPEPPTATPPKAKPHLKTLTGIRLVAWNIYGTLLVIPGGELYFHHPQKFIMEVALDKTLQEFKMWFSMSRKPGQPAEYLQQLYDKAFDKLKMAGSGGERHPEIICDRIWDDIIKKLLQKDYEFDASFFGSLNEYTRKVAYFFHASLQGTACYANVADALEKVQGKNVAQGLLADAQCFTLVQLQRGLAKQGWKTPVSDAFPEDLQALSFERGCRKPSENLFACFLHLAKDKGISPGQILHVGTSFDRDLIPARRLGMRTALFAGDKQSLHATPEQIKDRSVRPDVMLTELTQIGDVLS